MILHVGTLARTKRPARTGLGGGTMATLDVRSARAEPFSVYPSRAGQRGLLALAASSSAFGGLLGAAKNRRVTRTEAAAVCA